MVSINPLDLVALGSLILMSIGGIAAAIAFWQRGGSQASLEVITAQKEQIEIMEKRVITCETLHRTNLQEMGKIQGVVSTLERTLQGRNPEMETFMKYMVDAQQREEARQNEMTQILVGIKEWIEGINQKLGTEV